MDHKPFQVRPELVMDTISQDHSQGRRANEDSKLASFRDRSLETFDPSSFIQSPPKKRSQKSHQATGNSPATSPHVPPGKHHLVLYRVSCSSDVEQSPAFYQDFPARAFSHGHYHLSGDLPVVDFGKLTQQSSLAFIVFRDLNCKDSSQTIGQNSIPTSEAGSKCEDSIIFIDPTLRSVIDSVARCTHNRSAYSDSRRVSSSVDPSGEDAEYYHQFFYHHHEALSACVSTVCSPTKEYLQDLLAFLMEAHGAVYDQANALFSKGLVRRDLLKMLFCPNDIVLSKQQGSLAAYVLRSKPVGGFTLRFDCWYWGFDGQCFHRKNCTPTLARPAKTIVNIRDLEIYPLHYATEKEKDYLLQRGRKFWDLRNQNLMTYSGWDANADHYYVNESRCMIDYKTYRKIHPNAEAFNFPPESILPFDTWPESVPLDAKPDENVLILLPPCVQGFFLKDKKWVTLLVDQLGPVTWNKDAYERLVLPKRTKAMVKALVMVRTSKSGKPQSMGLTGKRKRDDLIVGKGSGLIMLLHGGPGTGKTLTAESVAEIAEMPLYSVTCGDIGTNADAVEKYLQMVLVLGKTWNCVLLLDEADVFLEERSLSDLERNSLVSVFLRILEYYDGILILTSNRIGTFDEAFQSRIQVALHYDNLDKTSRKKIWKNFFDMLQTDEEDVNLEELNRHMDELAEYDMNGRQIRNTLTTARQLALFEKETLGWEHLEQALMTVRNFNKYLRTLHGHSEEQYARDRELR